MVGGIKEYGISNDLKIKVIPKENSVVLEGYIRRGAKGELVTPQAEIDNVINGIARQTGQSVIPTVQGNNLVLRIGYKAPVSFTPASNALQLPAGRGIPNIPAVNTPQAAFQIIDPKVQAAVNLTQKRLNTLTTQRTSLVNKGNVSDNRAQLTDLTQQIQEQNQKLTDLKAKVNQTTGPVVT